MPFSSGTFSRVHDFTDDRDNGIRIQASRMDAEMDGIATGLSTALLKDGTQTATATIPFAAGISIIDNQKITFGTNSDITLQYDETTNDSLEIAANVEGAALGIVLKSDQGDDNADQHKLSIADGGVLTLGSKISGSFVDYLTHTPNSTVASSTLAVAGNLTVGGNLTLGSGAVLSEAELEQLDGITAGTVTASKAVVVDANKDIASFRNITLTGELDAGSLDISGDADIDGTLEADAMTLNGSAITTVATLSTGISNGNLPVFTSGVADDDFLRVNGTAIEGRSASEVLSDIGGQAALTFGISNTNIPIFTSGVADDDFLRVNGTSIEGRSASEVLSDIGASAVAGSSSIVTTGALNSGSITSGFGNIDTGSSTITTTGAITGGSLVADNITIDGTEIDLSSGDFTLDVAGEIVFDADGGNFFFNDGGTTIGRLRNVSSDFVISSEVSDKDLIFKGNDGGSTITALTLDMSDAGAATFNSTVESTGINFAGDRAINNTADTAYNIRSSSGTGQHYFGANRTGFSGGVDIARLGSTGTVFNESGADLDFRVESDGNSHAFFLEGSTGNIGIGESSPDKLLHLKTSQSVTCEIKIEAPRERGRLSFHSQTNSDTDYEMGQIEIDRSSGSSQTAHMIFATNGGSGVTERMRITAEGAVLINNNSRNDLGVVELLTTIGTDNAMIIKTAESGASGTATAIKFRYNSSTSGTISYDGSSTSYATSSDYRLKENVTYDFDATSRLKQLKPSRFNFIADKDTIVDGFLAHEVSNIVPEAVVGEKDAMTAEVLYVDGDVIPDGKKVGDVKIASEIDPQAIDQSKLIPLLTKALQEQQATIEALTARIVKLENA